jgi:uncharacterized protein (TIGR02996 family)
VKVEDAFLADILQDPDDDGPRRIYADWLVDHGQVRRGEFIHEQLAGRPGTITPREFMAWFSHGWKRRVCKGRRQVVFQPATVPEGLCARVERPVPPGTPAWPVWKLTLHRGFMAGVTLPLCDFMTLTDEHPRRRGSNLFRNHPLISVRFTDRQPNAIRRYLSSAGGEANGWRWWSSEQPRPMTLECELPHALWALLERGRGRPDDPVLRWAHDYPGTSPALAIYDLSCACVTFGRRQAKLPPLSLDEQPPIHLYAQLFAQPPEETSHA